MKATATRAPVPEQFVPVKVELVLESQAEVNALYGLIATSTQNQVDLVRRQHYSAINARSVTANDLDEVTTPIFSAIRGLTTREA